ncbi:MAG TPA: hypothetical protein VGM90_00105 [Kofleriaceae bacterium]|jgi:hypothetical protein
MSRWLLLAALALSGCIFPYAIPGAKMELGDSWTGPREGQTHFAVGAHLASIIKPTANPLTRVEVGAGLVIESGSTSPGVAAHEEPLTGVYADLGFAALHNSFARVIVGVRGEARATSITETHSKALKLRIDAELFKHVEGSFSGSGKCGVTSGVYDGLSAIGLYAESGPAIYEEGHEWATTIGFTARIPTIVGVMFGIPGCK